MEQKENITNALIDIVSPSLPSTMDQNITALYFIGAISVFILVSLIRNWYCSSTQQGLRQLKKIEVTSKSSNMSPRETVCQLSMLLKQHLGITYLSSNTVLPDTLKLDKERWRKFLQQLHVGRYKIKSCSQHEITTLIAETRYWLRLWP